MRILLIHRSFATEQEAGGTRHYDLARHLVALGFSFRVVTSGMSYLSGQRVDRVHREPGLDVERLQSTGGHDRRLGTRLVRLFAFSLRAFVAGFRRPRPDVVMGTSPSPDQALVAAAISLLRRRPLLLEIRDLWPEFLVGMGVVRNRLLIALMRLLERVLYRLSTRIVANSPAYVDYLLRCGVPADRVDFVPNGVDVRRFPQESGSRQLRRELDWDGRFIVLYAGNHGLANDLGVIVSAAAELQDEARVLFALLGDGPEKHNLRAAAERLAPRKVVFLDPCPKAQIATYLGAADACVATLMDIPMFRLTYPNKVFDYMAASRPTILGIDGVIREVVQDAQGGLFVNPGDPLALAAAVRQLLWDPAEAREMGRRGRAHVEQHFDFEQTASRLGASLRRAAQSDGRRIWRLRRKEH